LLKNEAKPPANAKWKPTEDTAHAAGAAATYKAGPSQPGPIPTSSQTQIATDGRPIPKAAPTTPSLKNEAKPPANAKWKPTEDKAHAAGAAATYKAGARQPEPLPESSQPQHFAVGQPLSKASLTTPPIKTGAQPSAEAHRKPTEDKAHAAGAEATYKAGARQPEPLPASSQPQHVAVGQPFSKASPTKPPIKTGAQPSAEAHWKPTEDKSHAAGAAASSKAGPHQLELPPTASQLQDAAVGHPPSKTAPKTLHLQNEVKPSVEAQRKPTEGKAHADEAVGDSPSKASPTKLFLKNEAKLDAEKKPASKEARVQQMPENESTHSIDITMERDVKSIEGQVAELENMVDSALDAPAGQLGSNFKKQLEDSRGLRRMLIKDLQRCTMMGQSALNLESQINSVESFSKKLVAERTALEEKKEVLLDEGDVYRRALKRAQALRQELASSILDLADFAQNLAHKKAPLAMLQRAHRGSHASKTEF